VKTGKIPGKKIECPTKIIKKMKKIESFTEDRLDETMLFFVRGGEDPPDGGGTEPVPEPTWPKELPPPPPGLPD